MSILPGEPGPIACLLCEGIIWIGKKLGILPKEYPIDSEELADYRKKMEGMGFHFNRKKDGEDEDICRP